MSRYEGPVQSNTVNTVIAWWDIYYMQYLFLEITIHPNLYAASQCILHTPQIEKSSQTSGLELHYFPVQNP